MSGGGAAAAVGTLRAGVPLERAVAAAVVVHGRDLTPEYMMDNLVGALRVEGVGYLLPRHPAGTWYPGRFTEPAGALEPWLTAGLDAIDAEVAAARAARLEDRAIVLVGFSQGACLVAELLARRTRRFGAAAILTGSLVGPPESVAQPGVAIAGMPMHVSGSRTDAWIPIDRLESTADVFAAAGADVHRAFREDHQHHIDAHERAAVGELIAGVAAAAAAARTA